MGGLLEFKKVADHANLHYIPMGSHNVASPIGTMACSQACAAIGDFLVIEYHAHDASWWGNLVEQDTIVDGYIAVNDRPGHGLTLNEDVARAHLKKGSSYSGDEPTRRAMSTP